MAHIKLPNHFDLSHAAEVLHTKYEAVIEPWPVLPSHKNFEAEFGLWLGNRLLVIQTWVDDMDIHVSGVLPGEAKTDGDLTFESNGVSYETKPEVVKYIEKIKHDIGLP